MPHTHRVIDERGTFATGSYTECHRVARFIGGRVERNVA